MRNLDKVVEHGVTGVLAIAGYVLVKVGVKAVKEKQVLNKVKQQAGKIKTLVKKPNENELQEEEV